MRYLNCILILLAVSMAAGCVERYITVKSHPGGAVVWLNGEEIGTTPATTAFTWYGTYEVVLRKDGYETLRTGQKADPPIYQWLGLDLFFESLWPGTLVDRHEWEFELTKLGPVDPNVLIDRATQLRQREM